MYFNYLNSIIFSIALTLSTALTGQFKYQTELPDYLEETSGICHSPEGLWNVNDGGNGSLIYLYPEIQYQKWLTTGSFDYNAVRTYRLPIPNIDWEAISTDSTYLYIGDFGNNKGNRKDLCIYKIRLSELMQLSMPIEVDRTSKNPSTSSRKGKVIFDFLHLDLIEKIEFEYHDQNKFKERKLHNFDCESMLLEMNKSSCFPKTGKIYNPPPTPSPIKKENTKRPPWVK